MTQSLLALRGGARVGGAIDGAGLFMDRMTTLIQLAGIAFAFYLVIQLKKQIDATKIELQKKVKEIEELKTQWDNGWDRHSEAMKKLSGEMKTQWKSGWERQNEAMQKLLDGIPFIPDQVRKDLMKLLLVQVDEE
eukprot:CAMPEP_0204612466 /NCGR_PEP_ID=MMETSP0717-20131115/549_1 /ASSEMBLY_ACC=CAM_ASM_000666 /TAXON_ID=230516 /ORGANISM="Chaetoceros curvisetus" /LENGTH=134 /DNA_ID=CAMNT_0051624559 /DNA_START=46 /DNA_END=450 /DNA_ORIENTATION=+